MRNLAIAVIGGLCMAGVGWAQTSAPTEPEAQPMPSLGEVARELKAQASKAAPQKPSRIYTNDDVPALREAAGVTEASTPADAGNSTSSTSESGDEKRGQKYYQTKYTTLLHEKEIHQRELAVLQQNLNIGQVQYYSDPNKALQQESTPAARSDINKIQADIDAKNKQLAADDQAISDLQDQLRHDGGDPGWLREGAVAEANSSEAPPEVPAVKDSNPKDKIKTKEYWQAQFKAARDNLARATEEQKLVQDEIDLLRRRQAQETSTDAQTEINNKLTARLTELTTKTEATDKAQKTLDDLQEKFDKSGAPADWVPPR